MEKFLDIFGKPEVTMGELYKKYNSLPSGSPLKKKLGITISNLKKKYIEKKNYVGILNISRYIGDYERDSLFQKLLKQHPDSSLFVLAFANSEMHSYKQAYQIETVQENDDEALRKDIELTLDTALCKFLSAHSTKEDLNYVQELTDGATWLEANKRSMRGLL